VSSLLAGNKLKIILFVDTIKMWPPCYVLFENSCAFPTLYSPIRQPLAKTTHCLHDQQNLLCGKITISAHFRHCLLRSGNNLQRRRIVYMCSRLCCAAKLLFRRISDTVVSNQAT
jgi:hypothetical protein